MQGGIVFGADGNGTPQVLKVDSNNNLYTTLATAIAGEDTANDVLKVENRFSYWHGNTAGTTTIKAAPGFLHRIIVGKAGSSSTVTVYDNTSASGNIIAVMSTDAQASIEFNVEFLTGLTIVVAGTTAPDVTVSYR